MNYVIFFPSSNSPITCKNVLICCWKQVSCFHLEIFIFLVPVTYSAWWHEKFQKVLKGRFILSLGKPLFEEVAWEIYLNASNSAHYLSWVKNTLGFFNKEWIDEENKAVFILIRHWKSFKGLSSLGKDVCHLNWLGIRQGFVCQQHLWARKDILHKVLHVPGTDLSM